MQTVRNILIWLRNTLLDVYYWPRARRELLEKMERVQSLQDAVDLVFTYKGAGFYKWLYPNQDREEIAGLAERVQAITPQVIVELGTRGGGTLFLWSQCALAVLVSIDLPGGIHGGGYPVQRAKLYRLFVRNHPTCHLDLLRRDSQTAATKSELVSLLDGRAIDFLFIDADHRYTGVKKDYELYADLVRPGGLIAFHDIRPNAKDESIQVYQLWDEIKAISANRTEEIIHEPYRGRYGIGVLTKASREEN